MLFIHFQQHNCVQVVYIAQFILRKTPVLSGHSCKISHSEPPFLREAKMCFSTPKPYCQAILMSSPHLSGKYVCFSIQCNFLLDEIFIFTKFILADALFTFKSANEIFFVNLKKTS
jgi:hypothetical protein